MDADKITTSPTSTAKVDVESAAADVGNAYQNADVYLHASMLILIRQLSNLAQNSENIISQIFDDSTKIERKWRKLTQRLQKIKQCADDLLNIDPKSIATSSIIDRFTAIKGHFASKVQESAKCQQGAFTPKTRPRHLIETCRALDDKNVKEDDNSSVTRNLAQMKSQICINNSEISTQTDDLLPFVLKEKNFFIVDENSNGHSSNTMEKSKVKPGLVESSQDDEYFFDAHNDVQSVKNGDCNFGTVNTTSACNETEAAQYSEIVAIKVDPRKKLKNGNNAIDHYAKINKKRRQTIEIAPMKRTEDFCAASKEIFVEKSPLLIEETLNSSNRKSDNENIRQSIKMNEKVDSFNKMADEYFYDFAPFYRRRKKSSILDQMNQFMSLKRSSKKNSIRCDSVVVEEPYYANIIGGKRVERIVRNENCFQSPSSKDPASSTLKQFFKRTLSLRLPSSDKAKKDNAPQRDISKKFAKYYENLPLRKEIQTQKSDDNDHYDELKSVKKGSKRMSSVIPTNRLSCNNTGAKYKQLSPSASSHDSAYSSCDQKAKRSSFDSTGSMTSLDLNNKNSKDGWYKQGFQVEYPSDCHLSRLDEDPVPAPQPPPRPPSSKKRITDRPLPLPVKDYGTFGNTAKDYCNMKSPTLAHLRRYCSKIESADEISSTYSCDAEGYYTSMHKDSGLSSKKAPTAKPANLHKLCANSSAANGNYEALDNWLLAKFRAELALNNSNEKCDSRSLTLPRKNVRFSK